VLHARKAIISFQSWLISVGVRHSERLSRRKGIVDVVEAQNCYATDQVKTFDART